MSKTKETKQNPEVKLTKSEQRIAEQSKKREDAKVEKAQLTEKYDTNLQHSDDSSDEEVLLRTGNVPKHWYDLYDHKGYSVSGQAVPKMIEGDEL
ncbi:MAG: hypothetical protein RLZ87_1218 [Armatimonadota bacterium]|jgi:ribosome biogenesis protein ERB1